MPHARRTTETVSDLAHILYIEAYLSLGKRMEALTTRPLAGSQRPPASVPAVATDGHAGWQARWQRWGPWLVVLVACAIGQIATLTQSSAITQTADTPSYMQVAAGILRDRLFFDPVRTPGYPALLALIFSIAGRHNLGAVVGVQAGLMVAGTLQLFGIARRLLGRDWLACGFASLLALNLYLLNWERSITTEALSIWTVITLFAIFLRLVATGRARWLIAFALWSVVMVLTRPFFLYLPALLLGVWVLRQARLDEWRRWWWQCVLAGVACYGLIAGYMWANAANCGYFGLSDVGSVNLFGKVLEYQMQAESIDPRFATFRHDLTLYLRQSAEPWGFPYHYPAYGQAHYAPLQAFSSDIILHHWPEYVVKTLPDVLLTLNAYPFNYAPFTNPASAWVVTLLNIGYAELGLYALLPIILVARLIAFWREPVRVERVLSLALALAVTGTVLMAASGAYTVTVGVATLGDFYRLRAPMDWAMILLLGEAVVNIGRQRIGRD